MQRERAKPAANLTFIVPPPEIVPQASALSDGSPDCHRAEKVSSAIRFPDKKVDRSENAKGKILSSLSRRLSRNPTGRQINGQRACCWRTSPHRQTSAWKDNR